MGNALKALAAYGECCPGANVYAMLELELSKIAK